MTNVSTALTIAGTDPSGGAGIQADLKTFQELKSYGMSIITSVVAQNTTGVQAIHHMSLEMIDQQLQSVISDIPVHAFKTGMIASKDMMEIISKRIEKLDAPYVMDPVMVATSGDSLINEDSRLFLRDHLLPLTAIVTPNIAEAAFLIEEKVETVEDMKLAAEALVTKYGAKAALVTGGHLEGDAIDILYDGNSIHSFSTDRIQTTNTHGTGCTYSAAITAYLGQGVPLIDAVKQAKQFVTAAITHSFPLGAGSGPTNHFAVREDSILKLN